MSPRPSYPLAGGSFSSSRRNTWISHDENAPVTAPSSPRPHAITPAAMTRPPAVTGTASPYPTVAHAHQTASPNVRIEAPWAACSQRYSARSWAQHRGA